jgi:hypothetical protein
VNSSSQVASCGPYSSTFSESCAWKHERGPVGTDVLGLCAPITLRIADLLVDAWEETNYRGGRDTRIEIGAVLGYHPSLQQ